MKKINYIRTVLVCFGIATMFSSYSQNTELAAFENYDFKPGSKILFDDQLVGDKVGSSPVSWKLKGGKTVVELIDSVKCIRYAEYYTGLFPKMPQVKKLPDNFTIEYDTWLDAGYDGNPGIQIHLIDLNDQEVIITPNKHDLSVSYPQDGRASKANPEEYAGETKFYNRWVHISIAYNKKHLTVYLDQYKQIDIEDCLLLPTQILVSGDCSQDMPILLKNFRIATGLPKPLTLENGKFITNAIKFDYNKADLKPESMSVLSEVVAYMNTNPNVKFEIGGHTDSDGDNAFNQKLSEARSNAVREQLIAMGIDASRLTSKGFGETKPLYENTTAEGKAGNRRVEFTLIK